MSDCLFCNIAAGKIPTQTVFTDDRVVVFGGSVPYTAAPRNLVRLNADGTLDLTFDTGVGPNSQVNVIIPTANGKISTFFASLSVTFSRSISKLDGNGS